ncbi:MAG: AmmeMemoRadiSam system protein B [Lentisphaerae bacterium]|nr:AmmeMemoRadiSam system protein B [Lentisphaerota bacterium]
MQLNCSRTLTAFPAPLDRWPATSGRGLIARPNHPALSAARLTHHRAHTRLSRLSLLLPLLSLACGARHEPTPLPAAPPPSPSAKHVLQSPLAGRWYPADAAALKAQLKRDWDAAPIHTNRNWRALILPHAGYAYSGPTAMAGIKAASGRSYRRVIVLGPTHRVSMPNLISLPDATHIATPLGEAPLDLDVLRALAKDPMFRMIPAAQDDEHSVQIEIPLLQFAWHDLALVPLVVGQLDAVAIRHAAAVLTALVDADTLVVASSDFTHYGPNYGYLPFTQDVAANLRQLDLGGYAFIAERDADGFLRYCHDMGATFCGRDPVAVLLAMLPADATAELLQYDMSGHITGDFENSVSYLAVGFTGAWSPRAAPLQEEAAMTLSETDRQALIEIARTTLQRHLLNQDAPLPADLGRTPSPVLRAPGAAFVTLTRPDGSLRGCIGDIIATVPLCESVRDNAIRAATQDPRFQPVTPMELPALHIEISVLTPPRPVTSFKEIELGRHGIILSKGRRRALFLPQVAPEQGWDLPETLTHLALKAGLPSDAWMDGAEFQVFEAIVFGEEHR